MITIREIFFRRTVAEHIARVIHRPEIANRIPTRHMRIFLLLTAVAILNLIDLAYTIYADSIGELREMNPLADFFLKAGQAPTLICFKVLMVMVGFCLLWKGRKSNWAVPACWVLMLAFTMLGVLWCAWVRQVNSNFDMQTAFGLAVR